MGEGGGGRGRRVSLLQLSLFRFHLSFFPQKRLILRLLNYVPLPSDRYYHGDVSLLHPETLTGRH